MAEAVKVYSKFSEFDIFLFKSGRHFRLYEKLGAHEIVDDELNGVYFAVWAPNARQVSVIGNFNGWNPHSHTLYPRWDGSGIWEGVVPEMSIGEVYKYYIHGKNGQQLEKADPFALQMELPPRTASIVSTTYYEWQDEDWMNSRQEINRLDRPLAVYELHLGSWRRDPHDPTLFLTYPEIAEVLVPYVQDMGFTHVEFMPVMEHPYYPSWGYQISGYFAATSRYGSPQDLMYLIERLHQAGIGVILDWVPSHFPGDLHGLREFDGSCLYEHEDPRQGFHPDWKSYIFNYGRNEVRSFLISNALFWLDRYHIDGLRVDAVASMLYLDYSRSAGQWLPNKYGGRENLDAQYFLQECNQAIQKAYPAVLTIAEESTSWAGVTRDVEMGGLGFHLKWMMGWMNDTLSYFKEDAINRKYHHAKMTFSSVYAFDERFMLPLSHDEVVHGKGSLVNKMPGDEWQRFANLRLLYLYMYAFAGSQLLFMGAEFGQLNEWNVNQSLDWHILNEPSHAGLQSYIRMLNTVYRQEPALYEKSYSGAGFQWLEKGDVNQSIFIFVRKGHDAINNLIIILNMTPVVRENYRLGLPHAGEWRVIFNSDHTDYFGSGISPKGLSTESLAWMGQEQSGTITIPPLGGLILKKY